MGEILGKKEAVVSTEIPLEDICQCKTRERYTYCLCISLDYAD